MRNPGLIHRFSSALDRSIEESQRNSIATFNDLSPQVLQEVRTVLRRGGPLAACEYLRFFVEIQNNGDAEAFCEEVVEGNAEAATWRTADCLLGVAETGHEGIGLSVSDYVAHLKDAPGELWFRSRRTACAQDEFPLPSVGPGAVVRNMRYWTPAGMANMAPPLRLVEIDPRGRTIERIQEVCVDTEIRRWMATLAAWWARHYLLSHSRDASVDGIVSSYPKSVAPSSDGVIAMEALIKEARLGDSRWPREAGFIGPNAWYR